MFGRKELIKLSLDKRTLVAESDLNRLVLRAEIQNLRDATGWLSEATRWPRKTGSLMLVLAPLAGFLLKRASRHPDSWLNRLAAVAKWIGPLYSLWKSFSASRKEAEAAEPAA